MNDPTVVTSWQPSMKLYSVFFIVMLLVALIGLRTAEIAASGHGWLMRSNIAMPWLLALLSGLTLWKEERRKAMDKRIAGPLLLILSFVVSSTYDAMSGLSGLVH